MTWGNFMLKEKTNHYSNLKKIPCAYCGELFIPNKRASNPKYCSEPCKTNSQRRMDREKLELQRVGSRI